MATPGPHLGCQEPVRGSQGFASWPVVNPGPGGARPPHTPSPGVSLMPTQVPLACCSDLSRSRVKQPTKVHCLDRQLESGSASVYRRPKSQLPQSQRLRSQVPSQGTEAEHQSPAPDFEEDWAAQPWDRHCRDQNVPTPESPPSLGAIAPLALLPTDALCRHGFLSRELAGTKSQRVWPRHASAVHAIPGVCPAFPSCGWTTVRLSAGRRSIRVFPAWGHCAPRRGVSRCLSPGRIPRSGAAAPAPRASPPPALGLPAPPPTVSAPRAAPAGAAWRCDHSPSPRPLPQVSVPRLHELPPVMPAKAVAGPRRQRWWRRRWRRRLGRRGQQHLLAVAEGADRGGEGPRGLLCSPSETAGTISGTRRSGVLNPRGSLRTPLLPLTGLSHTLQRPLLETTVSTFSI